MDGGAEMARLTDRTVRTAGPGRHQDGTVTGLMLDVSERGTRSWVLRYQVDKRRHDLGLGRFPEIGLARARERAMEARRVLAEGGDPLAERRRARAPSRTFREVAEALIAAKKPGWRDAKHALQWRSTLATFAFPRLGHLPPQAIDTAAVLDVLHPLWAKTPETASRVRQRIEAVLSYASAIGLRSGDNPARWRGHLDHLLARPSKVKTVRHHAALPWREAPGFMAELATREGTGARALRLLILTAARSGEVRGVTWREIEGDVWVVPATRTKSAREHRVPLTAAAQALLGTKGAADALVFASPSGRPLTGTALMDILRRMGRGELTVHGLRATFTTWAGESTPHAREVIEQALAHKVKDATEAAYARGDLLAKRRRLMADWAAFLSSCNQLH